MFNFLISNFQHLDIISGWTETLDVKLYAGHALDILP